VGYPEPISPNWVTEGKTPTLDDSLMPLKRLSIFNSVHAISPFVQFADILIISFDIAACSSLVMKFSPISFLMASVVDTGIVFLVFKFLQNHKQPSGKSIIIIHQTVLSLS
jgi:hypothetical protein